ncbi:hypothetical protein VPFG_00139 [Vibrio phage nt-1]|uniref:Uncharacterized protein n=1 Tax=Vibrio phage nt-1 TaxID=115992 RepID=R9TEG1_9CAUD|nr:hypothetical protein VPFG_00139 [Vibrio phage nt-1]AGN30141.1 hypothetical protein VPFG_00139 [Vibrio phage nt-1]
MTETVLAVIAISFVALVVYLYIREQNKRKAANAVSMRDRAEGLAEKLPTKEQQELDKLKEAATVRSQNGSPTGATRMKPTVTHTSRHAAPSRPVASRTRRDDDDIITNPLHPLNPITDPLDVYGSDDTVCGMRDETPAPTRSYSAPEPSYSEPEPSRSASVSSPGSYSFGGSSDSGSSSSSSSDSYSSSDSGSSSSGGGWD